MASDPVLSRPQMIVWCAKMEQELRETIAQFESHGAAFVHAMDEAKMFRAIAQALQEDAALVPRPSEPLAGWLATKLGKEDR